MAGYGGAIRSGKTTCGALIAGSIYLGCLHGADTDRAPNLPGERRIRAIEVVAALYRGFIETFGETDCHALTGCDWGVRRDIARYLRAKTYEHTCYRFLAHVVTACLRSSAPSG